METSSPILNWDLTQCSHGATHSSNRQLNKRSKSKGPLSPVLFLGTIEVHICLNRYAIDVFLKSPYLKKKEKEKRKEKKTELNNCEQRPNSVCE